MSAAGRANIIAALKNRWAAKRKADREVAKKVTRHEHVRLTCGSGNRRRFWRDGDHVSRSACASRTRRLAEGTPLAGLGRLPCSGFRHAGRLRCDRTTSGYACTISGSGRSRSRQLRCSVGSFKRATFHRSWGTAESNSVLNENSVETACAPRLSIKAPAVHTCHYAAVPAVPRTTPAAPRSGCRRGSGSSPRGRQPSGEHEQFPEDEKRPEDCLVVAGQAERQVDVEVFFALLRVAACQVGQRATAPVHRNDRALHQYQRAQDGRPQKLTAGSSERNRDDATSEKEPDCCV